MSLQTLIQDRTEFDWLRPRTLHNLERIRRKGGSSHGSTLITRALVDEVENAMTYIMGLTIQMREFF